MCSRQLAPVFSPGACCRYFLSHPALECCSLRFSNLSRRSALGSPESGRRRPRRRRRRRRRHDEQEAQTTRRPMSAFHFSLLSRRARSLFAHSHTTGWLAASSARAFILSARHRSLLAALRKLDGSSRLGACARPNSQTTGPAELCCCAMCVDESGCCCLGGSLIVLYCAHNCLLRRAHCAKPTPMAAGL